MFDLGSCFRRVFVNWQVELKLRQHWGKSNSEADWRQVSKRYMFLFDTNTIQAIRLIRDLLHS